MNFKGFGKIIRSKKTETSLSAGGIYEYKPLPVLSGAFYRAGAPLGEAFDLVERPIVIGGRRGRLYFVDGLSDSEKLKQNLFNFLMAVPKDAIAGEIDADHFMSEFFPLSKAPPKVIRTKQSNFFMPAFLQSFWTAWTKSSLPIPDAIPSAL